MKQTLLPLLLTTALLGQAVTSQANERRFAFTYEPVTTPKGVIEAEEQFFWESGKGFDSFEFRTELEYGVTDRLQLGLYLYNFEHAREDGDRETEWKGSGVEVIYQLTDPNKDWIGSALYGEVLANDDALKLEGKLLLQKNFGPLMVIWNGIVEAEWEDDYSEDVGVLEQVLGVSYQINPSFSVGLEAKHEVEFEHWEDSGGSEVFVGPNLSFRKGSFFAAVTCLFRVSDLEGQPDIELGTVVGFHF